MLKLRLIVITWFSITITGTSFAKPTIKVGAIPDQNPEKLHRLFNLISSELSSELQVKVKYVPVTNYPAAVTAFRTGDLDLVWFGGLTGVQARLQTPGAMVLAQRQIDKNFHSVFIANNKSNIPNLNNIKDLKLLKGKRFTFGSVSSTSGRLMPQYFLQLAGVTSDHFFGKAAGFSGSHDATIALVQSGSYEAGVLNEQVWKSNLEEGRINLTKVRVIWRTPPYSDYHWLVQGNLDNRLGRGFTNRLKNVLLAITPETTNGAKILKMFGAKKFIAASKEQYKNIELIGRQLGKIK